MTDGKIIGLVTICGAAALGMALFLIIRPSSSEPVEDPLQVAASINASAEEDVGFEINRLRRANEQLRSEVRRLAAENQRLQDELRGASSRQPSPLSSADQQSQTSDQQSPRQAQLERAPSTQESPAPRPPARYTEGNLIREMARMKAEIEAAFPTIPPDELVGKQFIIARNSAYENRPDEPFLSIGDFDDRPIYRDVAERRCTLLRLNPRNIGERAIIQIDGTNKRYRLDVLGDPPIPRELILASEIDAARARWRGRTLWYRGDTLLLEQRSPAGRVQSMKVAPWSRMTVVDVKPSWGASFPVRFILRTESGEQGYVDCILSGTTTPSSLRDSATFYRTFVETDPRTLFPHPPEIWRQIESKSVSVGMNREQVLLSWGEPRDVRTTVTAEGRREQWIYSDSRFVYLTDDAVSAIQN